MKRLKERGQLPLLIGIQRRQFLFQCFNAHGTILLPER
jgi:hypothetical protein